MNWTDEQLKAINTSNTNIIVSAGAGSGKTAVLTARTMRILNEGIHIDELLVLTFTKAAAGEMKNRIRKNIKKNMAGNPLLSKELELIDQAYITTFDSYALSVVKKYHYLLNISNDIKISDASIINMQKTKILDKVFDKYYENPTPEFTKLIYDFCTKDDATLKTCLLNIATKIDGLTNRDEYLNNYFANYYNEEFIQKLITEYVDYLKDNVKIVKSLAKRLSLVTDGTYGTKLDEVLSSLYDCESLDDFYLKLPLIKLPILPRGSEDEVKQEKERLSKFITDFKNIVVEYGNLENIYKTLRIMKDYLVIILAIIKEFLDELHKYKMENEIYDFQDIALLSIKILEENEEVRNEIRDSFKEIMIDEYQDTNDIQEKFISLIENNNVYMVGDIKQSIYRFRNANPEIFKNKYDKYAKEDQGIKIDLVQNFRSRNEVLNNINEVFRLIMDNVIGGAEYHESHQMVFGNNDYINKGNTGYEYDFEIREYDKQKMGRYSDTEVEIFAIAKDIKEKIDNKYQVFDKDLGTLRDIKYSDFVILMDRSTNFDMYKKVFEYLGIPLAIYKDNTLNDSDDIFILKNIINLIVKISNNEIDQEFRYAFTGVARSYLFEVSDKDILKIFINDSFKETDIYKMFKELATNLNSETITSLLDKIISKTKMYEKFIKVGNVEEAMVRISKLIDIASNLSSLGYNVFTFRDYLNELLDSDEQMKYKTARSDSNSVKIMTIHTSKGLEYNICYYSGLSKEFNIKDLNDRFLYDGRYGIITPYFDEGIGESFIKRLVKYHYLEDEISERIRLFYVALTRAREKMILLTPKKDEVINDCEENMTIDLNVRRKYKSFSKILDSIKYKINKYYKEIDIDSLGLTKEYLYNSSSLEKIENLSANKISVEEIKVREGNVLSQEHFSKNLHELINNETRKNMEFGTLVHETLEYIDFRNPDYSLIDNSLIKSKIMKFLSNPLLKEIDKAQIYKEHEFIYSDENNEYHGIIDLMLEYDDRIDIIDYKLNNIKDSNYLKQLEGYRTYIKGITNKNISIYLYSILSETLEKL